MAKATFEHMLTIHASADAIRSALSNYEFFLEHAIHRNLVRVRFLGERTDPDGNTRRYYRNSERVQLGPLPITVSNNATNYIDDQGAVVGEAFQSPGIHVMVISRCTAQPDGKTLVSEHVIVEAPRLLMSTVYAQAIAAHTEKLARLKNVLE
ncbi:MAG: hypothetical protein ACXWQ5_07320 [Ktedonobacterales bacterium]